MNKIRGKYLECFVNKLSLGKHDIIVKIPIDLSSFSWINNTSAIFIAETNSIIYDWNLQFHERQNTVETIKKNNNKAGNWDGINQKLDLTLHLNTRHSAL